MLVWVLLILLPFLFSALKKLLRAGGSEKRKYLHIRIVVLEQDQILTVTDKCSFNKYSHLLPSDPPTFSFFKMLVNF